MQKNENGKILKAFHSNDGKTLSSIDVFDEKTWKLSEITYFKKDGVTKKSIIDFDPKDGKRLTNIDYGKDAK